ncbi:MFS transporter [Actinoplanes aureus]|uniref:MFS transporter n=1 Tax=Actinoplanes aureus TaxID=2792083 RepID=A0A931FXV9_9ACTN|nr:MFS transporter [Actinoplanes aureus]MBG0562920.1 MFS transporter [Actinoplanes aureus]
MKQLNELIADFWQDYAALLLLGAGLVGVFSLLGLGIWARRSKKPLRPIALAVSMNLALLLNAEGMWVIAIDQLKLPKIFAVLVFAVFEICFLTATSLAAEQYRRTTVYGPDGKIVTPGHPGSMLYIAALIAALSGIIVASNAVTGTEKLLRLAVPCVIFLMWWAALTAAGQRVRRGRFAYSPRRLAERWGWLIPDDDPDLVRMAADRQVRRMIVNHHRVSSGRWPRAWWRSRLLKDARTAGEPVVHDVVEQLARIQRVMDLLIPGGAPGAGQAPALLAAADPLVPPAAALSAPAVPAFSPVASAPVAAEPASVSAVPASVPVASVPVAAVPASVSAVPASVPATSASVPAGPASVPAASASVPVTSASVPAGPASVPAASASVPVTSASVPAGPASVPAASASVPAAPASVPAASAAAGPASAGLSAPDRSAPAVQPVQFVQPVETDPVPLDAVPEVPTPRRSPEEEVQPTAVVPVSPAPAIPAWASTPTGSRPAVSIPGSPWWRLAVQNLSRHLATETSPEELLEMSYLQVTELARTLAPRVPELGDGVVRAFVIDYVRELSGEHGEAAYPWRDLLPQPAVAPKGSPAWLAGLEALRGALEEELGQGEFPRDPRELAELLAPSAPRLDDLTIRGFVTDYLQALGGQSGPGAAEEWQHLLPRPQGGRGASDEEILEVYGRQLDEILRATGRLSRYRVQSLTGVKSRVQADRIKATVEERVAAPA